MLREERIQKILAKLDTEEKVYVNELSNSFQVSMETIRKDLDTLEKEEKLKKVHGGAIKIPYKGYEPIFADRVTTNYDAKAAIGKRAADLIEDNEIIGIDAGTTTLQIIPFLTGKKNLTIVTHCIPVLNQLILAKQNNSFHGKIIFLGGEIDTNLMFAWGSLFKKMIEKFTLDKSFISCGGLSIEKGISDNSIEVSEISNSYIMNSRDSYIVADFSKVGVKNFYKTSDLKDVTGIISNKPCPEQWQKTLDSHSVIWFTS